MAAFSAVVSDGGTLFGFAEQDVNKETHPMSNVMKTARRNFISGLN